MSMRLIASADDIELAICQESCAFRGEPPCWRIVPDDWPNPECDEPRCHALAASVIASLRARSRM